MPRQSFEVIKRDKKRAALYNAVYAVVETNSRTIMANIPDYMYRPKAVAEGIVLALNKNARWITIPMMEAVKVPELKEHKYCKETIYNETYYDSIH